jgi:hypothetical protein
MILRSIPSAGSRTVLYPSMRESKSGINGTAIPTEDELDTDFRKNPISDPNCATFYDLRSQAAAVDQSPHGPFNG